MKTRIQNLFIALAWLALPALVQAQFTFTTNNGAITITGYSFARGVSLDVVIPAMMNGYPVTSIGDSAFYGNSITSVTIPNSVTNIGGDAFYDCQYLTSVTIPNSVTSIGEAAFYGCYSLTSVTIPNSVTNIGEDAFRDCTSLTSIDVDASNPVYSSMNGVLFDKAQATLLQFPGGLGGSYTIPNSVTSIGDGFAFCGLTSVTIPNSVTSIGGGAFFSCHSLTSVTIPNSVTTIGDTAFYVCPSLKSVTIPNSVTNIGNGAFIYCTSLTNITVDTANPAYSSLNGVLFDKVQATLLQFPGGLGGGYTIPNSVTNIGNGAFIFCTNLTNVTIPNSVTSIGDSAFYTCYSLTSVTIPNSVTNIGSRAFEECNTLTSVIIGNSVTSIGDNAFYYCTSLKRVYFQGNAPSPNNDSTVFSGDPATVYYLPGTTGWGATFDGRPTALWNPQAKTFSFTAGQFGFNLAGPANAVIVVEACTNLSQSVWLPVSTNTLSGLGTSAFSDPTGYPMRYYRFRSP